MRSLAVALLAALALTACGPGSASEQPADHPSDQPSDDDHGDLSDHDFALATRIARQEAASADAQVTRATAYLADNDPDAPSNTGHPCTSAKVLRITLVGSFPHTFVSGPGGTTDTTVTAAGIVADTGTGQVCLVGAGTGPVPAVPGEVELFR